MHFLNNMFSLPDKQKILEYFPAKNIDTIMKGTAIWIKNNCRNFWV